MPRRPYPSDLTDTEWAILEPLVPPAKPGGRPLRHSRRELVDAMCYVLRTGCAWRQLLHDLPPTALADGLTLLSPLATRWVLSGEP